MSRSQRFFANLFAMIYCGWCTDCQDFHPGHIGPFGWFLLRVAGIEVTDPGTNDIVKGGDE